MSPHDQPQVQLARRSLPVVARIAGRHWPSSSSVRSAAYHKPQMAVHSRGVGRSPFGCCVLPPATPQGSVILLTRVGSSFHGVSLSVTLPRYLGRRLRAGGSFPILTADGHGCRRVLAVDYQSADDLPSHAVQPLKRHSEISVSDAQQTYGHWRPNHWVSRTK